MTASELVPWRLPGIGLGGQLPETSTWLRGRIVDAQEEVAFHVAQQGLTTLAATAIDRDMCLRSQELIERCGDLADLIQGVTHDIHLLEAAPGYDVSHSEPLWPHRILVSVPDRYDEIGAVRFAEGVIHEAMHLSLTLLENDWPLVRSPAEAMASPWRDEPRPVGGVLHGLFVFSCLHAAFRMMDGVTDYAATDHISGRLRDIGEEVGSIDLARLSAGLTPFGCTLARQWSDACR